MSKIKKLTNAIRNYSESELCYGTIVTLKKIDDESDLLSGRISVLEQQNAEMLTMLKSIKELTIYQKRMSEERLRMELHYLGSDLDELIKEVEGGE